jgi:hypothetical protein
MFGLSSIIITQCKHHRIAVNPFLITLFFTEYCVLFSIRYTATAALLFTSSDHQVGTAWCDDSNHT